MLTLLDLSTELLIHIFSDLAISDFGSCLLTCHRIKDVIRGSLLLQYLIRTALAGVNDPLLSSGPPLPHRLESLKRWSDAWRQPGAFMCAPSRTLTHASNDKVEFLLRDDFLVALDFGGILGNRHVAGYDWIDLRNPSEEWTRIRFEQSVVPLAFTLDTAQQKLLAVLLGCPESSTFQLRLLEFREGWSHPLASRPSLEIPVPTKETHYIGLKAHMSMMGRYIVVAVGLPPESTGIDILLLVDWQKGHVTTLRSILTRTYLTDFLVLSDDILALIQGTGNAIELCQIRGVSTASLKTIRLLELPPLVPYARLATSTVKTENNNPGASKLATYRPPPRYSFGPSPSDALVLLTLTAKITGSAFMYKRIYSLAVHARTLLSHAASSLPHVSNVAVPWDAWGPPVTRCFAGIPGPSSVVAGQRWFERGIIRDFCPHRVRATGAGGTAQRSTLLAGRVFARDVESTLPYSEISLAEYDGILMEDVLIDSERIVFFVNGTSSPRRDHEFIIHMHTMG